MRGYVDANPGAGRFLVLSSASPDLLKQSSETLAGRIGYIEITPYFYRTHAGAEIDLVLDTPSGLIAIEIQRSLAPKPTKGFYSALDELNCRQAYVVYPGDNMYKLNNRTSVVPPHRLITLLRGSFS